MEESGKPNGGAHGNGTSRTLARIARLISSGDDATARPASEDGVGEAAGTDAHELADKSPDLRELTSDKLLDALPSGLAVCLNGKLLKANDSFALAFGYHDAAELEKAGGSDVLFRDGKAGLEKLLAGAAKEPENTVNLKAKTRSGRVVKLPVAVHDIASDTDEPARLIVLHPQSGDQSGKVAARIKLDPASCAKADSRRDDTAGTGNGDSTKKKTKKKKKLRKGKAINADATRTEPSGTADFLAKVSHELRTPLNSIIGFAELMKDEQLGPVGNERYRGYIRDIHDSGMYALSLVNDLLDISKIKSGEFELNFTAVDLEEVISESVQSMQPQVQRRRVLLRTSFADALPRVLADRRSMRQIILNLVSNAIKFTLPGGQVIVSVLLTETGGVRIRVRDTGIGMSKNEVAVAMKPYRQVDSAHRSQIGTGLGLPLTKALVEANRARFKVRSATGAGTRVDVTFTKERVAEPRS